MNLQQHQPPHSADARIDRALNALRRAEVPAGLEERVAQRVAARVLATASSRPSSDSSVSVIPNAVKNPRVWIEHLPLYVLASITLLLTLSLFILRLEHKPRTIVQVQRQSLHTRPQTVAQTINLSQARSTAGAKPNNRHRPEDVRPQATPLDPDAIALAETLAPSHPAPPMPLTPQERLLLSATRKGAPIEVSELDLDREPAFHAAAEAREKANLQQFARGLLAPLAISESLESTPKDNAEQVTSSSSN